MTWVLLAILVAVFGVLVFLLLKQRDLQKSLEKSPDADVPLLLLNQQIESLREQVRVNLEGNANTFVQHLGQLNEQLNSRLKDSSEVLQKSQESVGQRLDNAARVVGEVQGKLAKLEEANLRIFEVGKDIRSLQEILKAPKLRGSLGEYFLSDLLSQILPREHYELQHAFKNGEKVDAAIRLGDKWVPVDAKFPLENFQRILAAEQEADKKPFKKLFVSDVKKHIDAIAQKYIRPDEDTFDFALMYVPAENVYYEIIIKDDLSEGEHKLANYAMSRRVIPVSPNTLYVYLHTIVLGLKGLTIEKAAKDILSGLARLSADLGKISESFRKVGVHLNNAQGAFEDAEGRLGKFGDRIERLHGAPETTAEGVLGEDEKVRLLPTSNG
ncbi:MAG: DNA recombination protein RmuC [Deltaproteobacteria bacterium]|nr:DNA recombination protein RmuC [Deltaproteobacteria bacterium]